MFSAKKSEKFKTKNNPLTVQDGKVVSVDFPQDPNSSFYVEFQTLTSGGHANIGTTRFPKLIGMQSWQNVPNFAVITGKNAKVGMGV